MLPGSGIYPGYIEELITMLTGEHTGEDLEYRLNRLWNVLGAAFFIGQVDGLSADRAKSARDGKGVRR